MFLVSCMNKKFGYKFFFPDKGDQSFISITDIAKKLLTRYSTGGTALLYSILNSTSVNLRWFKYLLPR